MTHIITYRLLVLVLCTFSAILPVMGQYIINPSMEGQEGDSRPPYNWYTDHSWSNPNLLVRYSSLSGDKIYLPVDGLIFDLLRARGKNYAESYFEPLQREYLYQPLEIPLEANSCFTFSGYFCTNPFYSVADSLEPNIGFPLKFQMWGSNQPNSRDYLLVDTEPISNIDWEQKTYTFTTSNESLKYILIEVVWDTLTIKSEPYNGFILMDDFSLTKSGIVDTIANHTLYYKGDNETILSASDGISFSWDPMNLIVNPGSQHAIVSQFNEQFTVLIEQDNGCGHMEIFNLIYNCDTVHPPQDTTKYDVYYHYQNSTTLDASAGKTFDWEPEINLSSYDIQTPFLMDFHPNFQVEIIDQFNCTFTELFNVLINCDTLFPEKNILIIDTVLPNNTTITLNTLYPEFQVIWNPTEYLSCNDCPSTVAAPISSINYSATVTDEFGCIHNEDFNIEIELHAPNVITPNNDGFNDCFEVFGLPDKITLSIFDNTNRLVYHNDDYNPGDCWDGTDMNGNNLRADTYWYSIYHSAKKNLKHGFVLLVR